MNADILPFWNQVINGYYRHDIQELEAIQPASNRYGLCTVPQFLVVSSTLELLGKLLMNGDTFPGGDNQGAWKYYFEHYLPDLLGIVDPIQDLVRNGTAHLLLPKHIGIAKAPDIAEIFFPDKFGLPALNVAAFTKRFTASLAEVEADLTNDTTLGVRFVKKLNHMGQLHKDNYHKFESTIDQYLVNNPITFSKVSSGSDAIQTTVNQDWTSLSTVSPSDPVIREYYISGSNSRQ